MIAVSQAGFAYPHTEAVLTDVSCELHRGERVVLLGANGSGKTTLARLMNASLCPSSGEVRVDGTVTTAPSASISSRVGMIRQDPQNQLVSAAVYEALRRKRLTVALTRRLLCAVLPACAIAQRMGFPAASSSL